MADRFFPIKTQTACPLKWSWSTLYFYSGETASCHRTGWDSLTVENFNQFHNTEKKLTERSAMLNGQWPKDSCSYCRKIEDQGGFSDRLLHSTIPNQYPAELDADNTQINVTPTILEVYFNNTCNLSCLYCQPSLSSKLNHENKVFGPFDKNGVTLNEITLVDVAPIVEKFWSWMNNNSLTLKRFNVLGGEPFYQSEFYQLLDYFEQTAHPDLELGIVTNLAINTAKLEDICQRLRQLLAQKKLKRVDISCSIDCWGAEQEYVRYGLDLELWNKNFELLMSKKWLTLNINQTISVLTIKTMPDLLERLSVWRQQRPVGHFFSEVAPSPTYLMPHIFGNNVFDKDFEKILELIPESTAHQYMSGIANRINQTARDVNEIKKLHTFLTEKDRRRKTNWKQVFPWLESVFVEANVNE